MFGFAFKRLRALGIIFLGVLGALAARGQVLCLFFFGGFLISVQR